MIGLPRMAWAAALVLAAAVAPVAAAAPAPCGGSPQVVDAVGDGHHQNSDVTSAWFAGSASSLQAVIRTRVAVFEPAHADSVDMGFTMIFDVDGTARFVRATFDRSGVPVYDAGIWGPGGVALPEGGTTGAAMAELGAGVVSIDIPAWFGIGPASVIARPYVLTNDGTTNGVPHWVDRAPGGTTPDSVEYGADLLVAACASSTPGEVPGITGVELSAPARLLGGGTATVTGRVVGAGAGVAVRVDATGRTAWNGSSTTGTDGAFAVKVPIGATTTIRAAAAGLSSSTVTVVAGTRVSRPQGATAGARVSVRVAPALPGRAVITRPGGFEPLATTRVRAGRAVFTLPASSGGRARIVIIPDGGRAERGQSGAFTIH